MGAIADIAVFDPRTIGTTASYESPAQPPTGIVLVVRKGRIVRRGVELAAAGGGA